MKPIRPAGPSFAIDPDAHQRLSGRLQNLIDSKGGIENRDLVGVVYSLFRELETVHRRLNLLPAGPSLSQWFWRPMRQDQDPRSPSPQAKAYVFCLADTHAHVRDGQSLITLARHLSFGDAPAAMFEPIPVRAGKQEVPKVLQGIFPTVAMLVGRPVLFGSLMRQYFLPQSAPQRFTFTKEDPDAPKQGLRDDHFGTTVTQQRYEDEGEWVTEDYGLVRRFSFDDGPTARTFYVIAGLSSLGTYAATLCSLFLLDQLNRDLPAMPDERSQLDVLVSASATSGEAFWNLDASNVRIVRAYLGDLVFQADTAGTSWQAVPPRRIEMVLRAAPKAGALDIDHIALDRLERDILPGEQQQTRIIGCLIHRSMGRKPQGTSGTDLAEAKWIWRDRGKDKKMSASEAISKMLNVTRRHLGGALISKENRYFVEVPGEIKIKHP
ncbi:MAG: hypothetical protein JXQ73_07270 [Phycisphaerae bacterium]|nr:hypothetical protein [Phycisphaerae bacterium]